MEIEKTLTEVLERVGQVEKKYGKLWDEFVDCKRMLKIIYEVNDKIVREQKKRTAGSSR